MVRPGPSRNVGPSLQTRLVFVVGFLIFCMLGYQYMSLSSAKKNTENSLQETTAKLLELRREHMEAIGRANEAEAVVKRDLDSAKEAAEEKDETITDLEDELEKIRKEKRALEIDIAKQKTLLESSQAEEASATKDLEHYKSRLEEVQEQLKTLTTSHQELQESHKTLQSQYSTLQDESSKRESSCGVLASTLEQANTKLKSCEEQRLLCGSMLEKKMSSAAGAPGLNKAQISNITSNHENKVIMIQEKKPIGAPDFGAANDQQKHDAESVDALNKAVNQERSHIIDTGKQDEAKAIIPKPEEPIEDEMLMEGERKLDDEFAEDANAQGLGNMEQDDPYAEPNMHKVVEKEVAADGIEGGASELGSHQKLLNDHKNSRENDEMENLKNGVNAEENGFNLDQQKKDSENDRGKKGLEVEKDGEEILAKHNAEMDEELADIENRVEDELVDGEGGFKEPIDEKLFEVDKVNKANEDEYDEADYREKEDGEEDYQDPEIEKAEYNEEKDDRIDDIDNQY